MKKTGPAVPLRPLLRFALAGMALAGILYATLLVVSRTEGFCFLVLDRLSSRCGINLKAARARMDPGLNLVLTDVRRGKDARCAVDFHFSSVVLRWSWTVFLAHPLHPWTDVTIRGGECAVPSGEPPDALPPMAGLWLLRADQWLNAGVYRGTPFTRAILAADRLGLPLAVSDVTVTWTAAAGRDGALAEIRQMDCTPLAAPRRRLLHVVLHAQIRADRQSPAKALKRELLVYDDQMFLIQSRSWDALDAGLNSSI